VALVVRVVLVLLYLEDLCVNTPQDVLLDDLVDRSVRLR
jgi:hypothetical protein